MTAPRALDPPSSHSPSAPLARAPASGSRRARPRDRRSRPAAPAVPPPRRQARVGGRAGAPPHEGPLKLARESVTMAGTTALGSDRHRSAAHAGHGPRKQGAFMRGAALPPSLRAARRRARIDTAAAAHPASPLEAAPSGGAGGPRPPLARGGGRERRRGVARSRRRRPAGEAQCRAVHLVEAWVAAGGGVCGGGGCVGVRGGCGGRVGAYILEESGLSRRPASYERARRGTKGTVVTTPRPLSGTRPRPWPLVRDAPGPGIPS
jgi:hypothetical protein